MKKWLQNVLGILKVWIHVQDLRFQMDVVNRDLNKAFNRIERLEKTTRLGKRAMRYDEVERARKNRYKNWPKKAA